MRAKQQVPPPYITHENENGCARRGGMRRMSHRRQYFRLFGLGYLRSPPNTKASRKLGIPWLDFPGCPFTLMGWPLYCPRPQLTLILPAAAIDTKREA